MHLFIYFIYLQLMFISVLQVDLWIGGKWQNDLEIGMPETRKRTEHKKTERDNKGGRQGGRKGKVQNGKIGLQLKSCGSTLKLFTVPTEHIYTVYIHKSIWLKNICLL